MSSDDSKRLTRAYELDIPGFRAATSPAVQKRKASHTLAPSNLSQSKKHRSSSGDEADIGPHSLVAACSHLPQEVSEPTTPKTRLVTSRRSHEDIIKEAKKSGHRSTYYDGWYNSPSEFGRTSSGEVKVHSQVDLVEFGLGAYAV